MVPWNFIINKKGLYCWLSDNSTGHYVTQFGQGKSGREMDLEAHTSKKILKIEPLCSNKLYADTAKSEVKLLLRCTNCI